jgi:hypothetical protein
MNKLLLSLFLYFSPSLCFSLTWSDVREQVRIIVKDNDSTRRRYSDAQLLDIANEAQRDISNATWIIYKSTSIPLVAGTTYYTLPSDTIEITRVTREYKTLEETTFDKEDSDNSGGAWETTTGTPVDYFQDSTRPDSIGIKPFPNASSSTGTLRIHYVAQPIDLSADIDIPFNSHNRYLPYHDTLIYYICTRIFMIENEQTKIALYSQLYESRVALLRERVGLKPNYMPGFSGQRSGQVR